MLEEKDDASSTFRLRCQRFFPPLSGVRNNVDFVTPASDFEGVKLFRGLPNLANAIGSQGIVIYS